MAFFLIIAERAGENEKSSRYFDSRHLFKCVTFGFALLWVAFNLWTIFRVVRWLDGCSSFIEFTHSLARTITVIQFDKSRASAAKFQLFFIPALSSTTLPRIRQ